MPILQYKCRSCSSVFDQSVVSGDEKQVECLSCASSDVSRSDSSLFDMKCSGCDGDDGCGGSCKYNDGNCSY